VAKAAKNLTCKCDEILRGVIQAAPNHLLRMTVLSSTVNYYGGGQEEAIHRFVHCYNAERYHEVYPPVARFIRLWRGAQECHAR
jgi:hypothetical protein